MMSNVYSKIELIWDILDLCLICTLPLRCGVLVEGNWRDDLGKNES